MHYRDGALQSFECVATAAGYWDMSLAIVPAASLGGIHRNICVRQNRFRVFPVI
jgi:hypothetical protein